MSNNVLLRKILIDEEGIYLETYRDSLGKLHCLIGHNLEIEQTDEELAILEEAGYDGTDESLETLVFTEEQAYRMFDIDVEEAINDIYPTFDSDELDALGEVRRAVILSMVFQCGGKGFRGFRKFIAAVKEGDFETASVEMMDSRAAKQTKARWERASEAMRTAVFEKYQEVEDTEEVVADTQQSDEVSNRLGRIEKQLKQVLDYLTAKK